MKSHVALAAASFVAVATVAVSVVGLSAAANAAPSSPTRTLYRPSPLHTAIMPINRCNLFPSACPTPTGVLHTAIMPIKRP